MKNTKLGTLLLLAAGLAAAQTTLTYTAPAGSLHCSNRVGQLPAVNHSCPMGGLVGATGTQTANFQTQGLSDGSDFVVFRIVPGVPPNIEAVEADGNWAPLSSIPPAGQPVLFSFDAAISNVCLEECSAASGAFHLEGQWSWQYVKVCGIRYCNTYQEWTNTTPVVVTITQTSGVPIVD